MAMKESLEFSTAPSEMGSDNKTVFTDDQGFVTAKAKVNAPEGLDDYRSFALVKLASSFSSDIFVEKDGEKVNAKSIMGLMMLAAGQGSEVTVYAKGADAKVAVAEIMALFSRDFDIPPPPEYVRFPRAVILDDDPWYLEMLITTICKAYPQAKIISFDDGDKAWDGLTKQDPDLFIFDDYHPGIRGCEIARRLADRKAQFPMIFATGTPAELLPPNLELKIKVLLKPFTADEFRAAMLEVGDLGQHLRF